MELRTSYKTQIKSSNHQRTGNEKKKILNSKISNLNREKKVSLKRSEWVIENIAPIIDGRNTMTGLS